MTGGGRGVTIGRGVETGGEAARCGGGGTGGGAGVGASPPRRRRSSASQSPAFGSGPVGREGRSGDPGGCSWPGHSSASGCCPFFFSHSKMAEPMAIATTTQNASKAANIGAGAATIPRVLCIRVGAFAGRHDGGFDEVPLPAGPLPPAILSRMPVSAWMFFMR